MWQEERAYTHTRKSAILAAARMQQHFKTWAIRVKVKVVINSNGPDSFNSLVCIPLTAQESCNVGRHVFRPHFQGSAAMVNVVSSQRGNQDQSG